MSQPPIPDKELWKWYILLEKHRTYGGTIAMFCADNGVSPKNFWNARYRIEYKFYSDPVYYAKLLPIAELYTKETNGIRVCAVNNDVPAGDLRSMVYHLNTLERIERLKLKYGTSSNLIEKPMDFFQVPRPEYQEPTSELLVKRNDIELNISIGVKVVVSPEISSEKLIKIIELLKDL